MASFSPGDVVVFLSPDIQGPKRGPAVVVSTNDYHASRPDAVVGLLTSQVNQTLCASDHLLVDWPQAGLRKLSVFRAFLTTSPQSEMTYIGHLSARDWVAIQTCLRATIDAGTH